MMANPYQGDDVDPFGGARDEETGDVKQTGLARTAKLSPFGLAFDTARKAGEKTFEFNGKKYTTELAKPKSNTELAKPKSNTELAKPKSESEVSAGPRVGLSDRSVAKAEGSFSDRQAYKRATRAAQAEERRKAMGMKKGGTVSSASKRADGCAQRGKTRGKMV